MITIGNTNTSDEDIVKKFNAAIRSMPDCTQPLAAAQYEKLIKNLSQRYEEKQQAIYKLAEAIKALEPRMRRLQGRD